MVDEQRPIVPDRHRSKQIRRRRMKVRWGAEERSMLIVMIVEVVQQAIVAFVRRVMHDLLP
jgi:hypothetical protein